MYPRNLLIQKSQKVGLPPKGTASKKYNKYLKLPESTWGIATCTRAHVLPCLSRRIHIYPPTHPTPVNSTFISHHCLSSGPFFSFGGVSGAILGGLAAACAADAGCTAGVGCTATADTGCTAATVGCGRLGTLGLRFSPFDAFR